MSYTWTSFQFAGTFSRFKFSGQNMRMLTAGHTPTKLAIKFYSTLSTSPQPTTPAAASLRPRSSASFQVELPPTMRIHDVFHVDRFKPLIPSPESLDRRSLPPPEEEIVNGEV
ncbi:hypothetical protein KI688_002263 [Linnemannia hyalina]|uniref:Uncharacterized protein n=1 Tax=Linnemannia hyalina TaxID=64524 RepID=A0A9P8BSE9_9FUNG|nr:hypothetical protein KI688_002263 [Linnemannia hyalina]